jgi:hypothetical protein
MSTKESKICTQEAAHITRDITIKTPETVAIKRKSGNATSQCHYGSIQDWIVDHLWYKETLKNITWKNLGE